MFNRKRILFILVILALFLWIPVALSGDLNLATVTLSDKTVTYSGAEVPISAATVVGVDGLPAPTGSVTYAYYTDNGCTQPNSGTPKNAGTYYAKAFLLADGIYDAGESNVATLTIIPATPSLTLSHKAALYTGGAVSISHTQVHGISGTDVPTGAVTYAYYSDTGFLNALPGAPINAGTYYVKAFIAADGNYSGVESGAATLIIIPATPTLIFNNKTSAYTGTAIEMDPPLAQGISETDVPTGVITYAYFKDIGCTQSFSGTPKNAGTYYAKASIPADGNYTAQTKVATLSITKKLLTGFVYSMDGSGKAYDGNTSYNGGVYISFNESDGRIGSEDISGWHGDVHGSMEYVKPDAGMQNVMITATLNDTETARNYTFAGGNQLSQLSYFQVMIHPATPGISLSDKTVPYNGVAATIGSAVTHGISSTDVPTGAVTYTYYPDEACLSVLPAAPKNVGMYYVKATVAAHGNYATATSSTTKLVITPVTPTLTLLDKTVHYTGSEAAIAPATSHGASDTDHPLGSVTYTYYTDAACENPLPTVPIHIGTYYVRAAIAQDGNYTAATSNTATLTIEPKQISILTYSIDDSEGKVYDGTDMASGTGECSFQGLVSGDILLEGTDYTFTLRFESANAGLRFLVITTTLCDTVMASKYAFAEGKSSSYTIGLQYEISRATPGITLSDTTATYSGYYIYGNPPVLTGIKEGDVPSGSVTYMYYLDEACTTDAIPSWTHAPVFPGTYYVKAALAAEGNYSAEVSNVAKLTITPAIPTISLEGKTAMYNGSAVEIDQASVQGINEWEYPSGYVTYAYYSDATCLEALPDAPINAGTYYVKAFIDSSWGYDTAQSSAVTLTITPAVPSITIADKDAIYTGNPVDIGPAVVTGVSLMDVTAGAVTYKYFTSSSLTNETDVPVAPGTYYVVASIAALGNYTAAVSESAKLTIAKPDRPLLQVQLHSGKSITLLTDVDTVLHMNWSPVKNLVMDQKEEPVFFSASISSYQDNTYTLMLELMADSDKDGNVLVDAAGKPVYGMRILNLSMKLIRSLLHRGISVLNVAYGQMTVTINLSDFKSLPGLETAEAFRLKIEPAEVVVSARDDAGALIARDGAGLSYRIKVLAVLDGKEQDMVLQLPGLSLSVKDQP